MSAWKDSTMRRIYYRHRREKRARKRYLDEHIMCAYCEVVVLRVEFIEHEAGHRKTDPELYEWIDSHYPNWEP